MIALIHPPQERHFVFPKAANAPTGLLPVIRPKAVSATIMEKPKVSARII